MRVRPCSRATNSMARHTIAMGRLPCADYGLLISRWAGARRNRDSAARRECPINQMIRSIDAFSGRQRIQHG